MENDAVRFQISPDPKRVGGGTADDRAFAREKTRRESSSTYLTDIVAYRSLRCASSCDGSRALVLALEAFFEILGPLR